jgi:hypothetical protein
MTTINGAMAAAINANRVLMKKSTAKITATSSTWLIKLSVSVTTLAKSCVSEVTRLTTLPVGYSS